LFVDYFFNTSLLSEVNCISIKNRTYKYDVILWIVGISSANIESIPFHRLQNADVVATVKELRGECIRKTIDFNSFLITCDFPLLTQFNTSLDVGSRRM
jgi:hypothetical protein